jgi:hypothetical protein
MIKIKIIKASIGMIKLLYLIIGSIIILHIAVIIAISSTVYKFIKKKLKQK